MEIDAVITWVDGSAPTFIEKFESYEALAQKDKDNPDYDSEIRQGFGVRYHEQQELRYCLRSIIRFAPWVRKIWIVTDSQFPWYLDHSRIPRERIQFIPHEHIFRGYESVLPTFNSSMLEWMLWRIEGLAEHFLYLNDDFMFLPDCSLDSFFAEKPILRGRWGPVSPGPRQAWLQGRVNAARYLGFSEKRMFLAEHAPYAQCKSVWRRIFTSHATIIPRALRYRFKNQRHLSALSFYAHFSLLHDAAVVGDPRACLIFGDYPARWSVDDALRSLASLRRPGVISICFNHLASFRAHLPMVTEILNDVIGPPLEFELPGIPPLNDSMNALSTRRP